jgi:hypothetical protein
VGIVSARLQPVEVAFVILYNFGTSSYIDWQNYALLHVAQSFRRDEVQEAEVHQAQPR